MSQRFESTIAEKQFASVQNGEDNQVCNCRLNMNKGLF